MAHGVNVSWYEDTELWGDLQLSWPLRAGCGKEEIDFDFAFCVSHFAKWNEMTIFGKSLAR